MPTLADLTPEHRDLVTEHHDLRVFGRLAAAEQHQPAKDPNRDQVEQAKGHKPRSCRNRLIRPNRRSQYLRRILKRHRTGDMNAWTTWAATLAVADLALAGCGGGSHSAGSHGRPVLHAA